MSRIGRKPISVPAGVRVTIDPQIRSVSVEGPKGKLSMTHRPEVAVTWEEGENRIICAIPQAQVRIGQMRAYWGLTRALISNMIVGVTELPRPMQGMGVVIVSTSRGVMSDRRCREENVGGELVAIVS